MPDFSKLLKKQAGTAKRPTALPVSSGSPYHGIIKSFEIVEAPSGRPVDYESIVRFQIGLLDWPDVGIDESQREEEIEEGVVRPIDLSKKQMRRDFYDNSLYRLDEFLKSLEIDISGREYEEVLPEAIGKRVLVEVQQYLNQRTNEIGNQIGSLVGE